MISSLVSMNSQSNGVIGLFITVGLFFVFLAVLSFIDNMETFLAANFLTAIVALILWFNGVVYFPVVLGWVLVLMVVIWWKNI